MANEKIREILKNSNLLKGANTLGTISLYGERAKFDRKHKQKLNSIDLRTNRSLYGRLDLEQNVIIPDIEKMVNLRSNGQSKNHMVLPFVNDAYIELESKINELLSKQVIKPDKIMPFTSQETSYDIQKKYKQNLLQILDVFYEYIVNDNSINKIFNFKDFINSFLSFTSLRNVSLTLTDFTFSQTDINGSGLVIDTIKQPMDLDILKELFYQSNNYNSYNRLLQNYGFMVDVYAPWRIIFNFDNKNSHKYMSKYEISNMSDIFEDFYTKTYEIDMSNFLDTLLYFYNEKLCVLKSTIFTTFNVVQKNGIKTYNETNTREKITEEEIFQTISIESMLKLYFYLRLREESIDLSQQEFNELMNELTILYRTTDVNAVNKFVNNYTKFLLNDGANPRLSLTRDTVTSYNNLNVYFRV